MRQTRTSGRRSAACLMASADALAGERTTEMFAPGLWSVQNNQNETSQERGEANAMSKIAAAALIGVLAFASAPAMADAVSDFYRGKQIRVIVRTTPATDYDQYSRLIARFMGKYIPGNPSMIVVNMPGGGGITAANYFTQVAPHDGTVIGIVSQGLAADQALGMSPQLKADLREFNWIANVIFSNQLLAVWHTSPTKTIEEAKQRVTTIGTTGAGSASVQYPAFYNNVLGTKFKIVFGYPGGAHIDLAMERGEVEGRGTNPYSSYMGSHPDWIPRRLLIPLVQSGIEKEPELPDVPLITELPVRPADKPLLEFMARASTVGRPLATTPGVPADRVAALRAAFATMIKDPEFIAAAATEKMEVRPQTGAQLQDIIFALISSPADVRERMKIALQPKDEQILEQPPSQR
jgi:tripartite-type tricarboxylate transporter receptor subunit TctC